MSNINSYDMIVRIVSKSRSETAVSLLNSSFILYPIAPICFSSFSQLHLNFNQYSFYSFTLHSLSLSPSVDANGTPQLTRWEAEFYSFIASQHQKQQQQGTAPGVQPFASQLQQQQAPPHRRASHATSAAESDDKSTDSLSDASSFCSTATADDDDGSNDNNNTSSKDRSMSIRPKQHKMSVTIAAGSGRVNDPSADGMDAYGKRSLSVSSSYFDEMGFSSSNSGGSGGSDGGSGSGSGGNNNGHDSDGDFEVSSEDADDAGAGTSSSRHQPAVQQQHQQQQSITVQRVPLNATAVAAAAAASAASKAKLTGSHFDIEDEDDADIEDNE